MPRIARTARTLGLAAGLLLALLPLTHSSAGAAGVGPPADDTIHTGADYNDGKPLPLDTSTSRVAGRAERSFGTTATTAATAAVPGDVREWLALDDVEGAIYLKEYTLRAVGENIEVWVANDLMFPEGDCRNDERVVITDEQVARLVSEFDGNMYPKESAAFSVPPARDGTASAAEGIGFPADYWTGDGDNIVTLIDNVVDANFFDLQGSPTYIAGFFFSTFNELLDRNVMTVDAFDWLHRTGDNPPNEPVPGDLCASKPARPNQYEGTFAHEYQHLLEYYEDADETSWVNEGLADWAQTLTGYVDPSTPITNIDFDSHVQCFLGWGEHQTEANPNPRQGGPENGLTLWGDPGQAEDEILCDYGAAYTLMEYLHGLYGDAFMTALHRDDLSGLESLQTQLDAFDPGTTAEEIVHRWAAMVALDGVLDDNGGWLAGGDDVDYRTPTLDATIDWANDDAFSLPGAPPNGSDYVRLRGEHGFLKLNQLKNIEFDGAELLPSLPVEWTVDATGGAAGDPALHSGAGDNLDRAIVAEVTVPADDPTLRFATRHDTEELWDYGFVQVSTDGGATYTSLPATGTTTDHDPGAVPQVVSQLPGFTGDSGGWVPSEADLSAYAGQTILVSFRYITDPGVTLPGFWVDDVRVGSTLVSDGSSLGPFRSMTEIRPIPVGGWTVQLIGYSSHHRLPAGIVTMPLDDANSASFDVRRLVRAFGRGAGRIDVVAAIITQDDPTELVTQYAPYELSINGVLQPGGS